MTALLVSALATVAGAQAPVAPDWIKVETAHFSVYGSSGPAADVARQLEVFDALLTRLYPDLVDPRRRPLPVLLFADADQLGTFLTPSRRERRLSEADLLFEADGPRPLVALDGSTWTRGSREVLRRYADHLLDGHPQARPWLRIGLAEYFATAVIQGDAVILGEANEAHLALLKDSRHWIGMGELLAADRDSPLLRIPRRRAQFAAQAWLLVHWLQLDPQGERQARLADLAGPAHRATVIEPAAFDPLTTDGHALEKALRAWLGGDLPTNLVEISDSSTVPEPLEVPGVEVEYRLGTLLAAQRRLDEAETHFRSALALSPDSWMPHDGLGQLEVCRQRWADARDAFDDAITRKPTDPAPFLEYGMATFHGLGQRGRRPAARLAFEQALALDSSLLDAYAGLSMLAYGKRDWTEAARWAGRGLQIDPGDGRLRALLGRAQLASGDFDRAMLNAQIALRECEDLDTCTMAQALYRATVSRL
jgi:tetratricopeptide (TPR) repeat protein